MRCPNCGFVNAPNIEKCEKCSNSLNGDDTPSQPSPPTRKSNPASNVVNATVIGQRANVPAWDDPSNAKPSSPVGPAEQQTPSDPIKRKDRPTEDLRRKDSNDRSNTLTCPNPSCRYINANHSNFCVACGTSLVDNRSELKETQLAKPGDKLPKESTPYNTNPLGDSVSTPPPPPFPSEPPAKPIPPNPNYNATVNPWSQRKNQNFALKPLSREGEQLKAELHFEGHFIELNRSNLEPSNASITNKVQALIEFRDGSWYLINKSSQQTTFIRVEGAVPIKKGDVLLLGDRLFEFDC